ncbi:MAG TPA: aspartate carbamoyltransferase catalytic subunit [Candidatus Omnitrophota bacterium]|nr:aspartate carbamoyltransferase catalytic subunit [Candidatus Omnitrophota bacterium]
MGIEWKKKDLLGLETLSKEEIEMVLETAKSFKEVSTRDVKKVPALRGKTVVSLFFEDSTRTRASFELAAKRLSADTINIAAKGSSLSKGETILDMAKNMQAMNVNAIIVRHSSSGVPKLLAENLEAAVINAGDGCREHPTQALLDMFTIKEKLGEIKGKKVAIIGDILHSRVARSNIWGLTKLGAQVTVCGPSTLMPIGIEKLGVKVTHSLNECIAESDVLMLLRIQLERQRDKFLPSLREYAKEFGINKEKLKKAKKNVLIMHPGPTNRGLELSADVADGEYSVILDQVTNGIAIRMAILYLLLAGKAPTLALARSVSRPNPPSADKRRERLSTEGES